MQVAGVGEAAPVDVRAELDVVAAEEPPAVLLEEGQALLRDGAVRQRDAAGQLRGLVVAVEDVGDVDGGLHGVVAGQGGVEAGQRAEARLARQQRAGQDGVAVGAEAVRAVGRHLVGRKVGGDRVLDGERLAGADGLAGEHVPADDRVERDVQRVGQRRKVRVPLPDLERTVIAVDFLFRRWAVAAANDVLLAQSRE